MKLNSLIKTKKAMLLLGITTLMAQAKVNAQELYGGELQSKTEYTYGKVEMRMYSEYVIGTTSTYFWWRNGGQECNYQWNEIDIETLPLFNQYQSNPIWQRYDNDPGNGSCKWLSEARHGDKATVWGRWIVYTLEWCPEYIAWYHDGILDRKILKGGQANDPVGSINKAMRYCYNLWTQGESPGWLGNLDWNALQNNPVYQWVDYFKYYAWNGTGFNATATKTINFDSDADITNNFTKSTWGMSESKGHVQWDPSASGVTKLSDGNGVLWLGLGYKGQMHAPYASDLPAVGGVTNVAVTGVTLSAATLALTTPGTGQLTATVAPTNATNKAVTWTTSNAAVATVSATGLVSSVAAGTATITAKTTDGAKVATCVVTVTAPITYTHAIPGTIEAEQFKTNVGLVAEATSDVNGGMNLGYTDNGDYADYTINVTAAGNYNVDFRVASLAGGAGLSLSIDGVKVINDLAIASTSSWQVWNTLTSTIALTQGTHTLRFDVIRAGFNLNWIKLSSANVAVTGVTLSAATLALTAPATSQLTATVAPTNATNKAVTWTTSNAAVATVSATGLVSSVAAGTATITAKTTDGAKVATCVVTVSVTIPVTGVTLSAATLALTTPATSQLTATVAPTNATNKAVTWTTSNAAVATVSATGLVSSVAAGTATITAKTTDGAKVASCVVTVSVPVPTFNLKIEAELYSVMFGVQTQATTDAGGGLNVGYLDPNDWMAYNNITIPTTGTYTMTYRIASLAGGGKLQLETNAGATILDPAFAIPSTGGWQNWQTVTRTVTLPAGTYNLGLNAVAGGFNINWFTISKAAVLARSSSETNFEEEAATVNGFKIYPNPATEVINLSQETAWELVDLSGLSIMSGSGKVINTTNLTTGMYVIKANGISYKVLIK